jgi:hypothetical protein
MLSTLVGAACGSSDKRVTCADCFTEGVDPTQEVCFESDTMPYYSSPGIKATLQEFCKMCPSGCGPFR